MADAAPITGPKGRNRPRGMHHSGDFGQCMCPARAKSARRLNAPRSAGGIREFNSCSTLTGSFCAAAGKASVRCSRWLTRRTWVSTGSPGSSKATLRTTLPVLRPTPGRVTRSSSVGRHLSPEALRHGRRHADEVLGLRTEEPRRTDELLDVLGVGGGERLRVGIGREERGRDQVDPHVGALRRQDGGHQQLERVLEVQRAELRRAARVHLRQALLGQARPTLRCPGLRHRFTVPGYVGRSGH